MHIILYLFLSFVCYLALNFIVIYESQKTGMFVDFDEFEEFSLTKIILIIVFGWLIIIGTIFIIFLYLLRALAHLINKGMLR